MNKEIWEDIEDYEGLYQISNCGRVKSLIFSEKRILKNIINNNGYFIITLCKNNKCKTFTIHRLVALHFIPNPEDKPQVNHKDGDKLNNYYKNLEWCTASENVQHAWKNNLCENIKISAKK